jgi:UDP-N-acetyl-D-glucosamine dehydrogenase
VNKNQENTMRVVVIGMGYVGLPLAMRFAETGHQVWGYDIDEEKIESLKQGRSYIGHIESALIESQVEKELLIPSTDISCVQDKDAVVLCVPTPLTRHREPDISYILKTAEAFAPHLSAGTLVVLESTTYPGTTDGVLKDKLEEISGMRAGVDFHLAFSPEREDPGNQDCHLGSIPKVVGGLTEACRKRAVALYRKAVPEVVEVSSCRAAEATKLLENIFRCVNIALVNELKVVYHAMDIDVWEVIGAAKTKPFGYMPFYPGPGLGGHCIPIDPFYLTWKAREFNQSTRFIELAGELNTSMPNFVVQRVGESLNASRKSINGAKILIVGLSYKPDVADVRESPTFTLMEKLGALGASVDYYDTYVPEVPTTREHAEYAGKQSVDWNQSVISSYDLVLISTAHSNMNWGELNDWAQCIVDTRNAMQAAGIESEKVWKA